MNTAVRLVVWREVQGQQVKVKNMEEEEEEGTTLRPWHQVLLNTRVLLRVSLKKKTLLYHPLLFFLTSNYRELSYLSPSFPSPPFLALLSAPTLCETKSTYDASDAMAVSQGGKGTLMPPRQLLQASRDRASSIGKRRRGGAGCRCARGAAHPKPRTPIHRERYPWRCPGPCRRGKPPQSCPYLGKWADT